MAARTAAVPWAPITRRRLSCLSAMTPPIGPKASSGRNCSATTMPTAAGLWVSWSTSQSCERRSIHTPVPPLSCATRNSL